MKHHIQTKKVIKFIKKNVTVFDIFLVAILFSMGIFFFFFFYRESERVEITVKVTNQEILYADRTPQSWYARRFKVGDSEKDALGRPVSEVIAVDSFAIDPSRYEVYLTMLVKATYDSRSNSYSFRGRNLAFGTPIRMNLANITFDGVVVDFPGSDHQVRQENQKVSLLSRKVEPFVANSIEVGDVVKNSRGDTIAEILEVTVEPAEEVVETQDGRLVLARSPRDKDVYITASLQTKTYENNKTYVFNDIELLKGAFVPLNLDDTSIYPVVTELHNK